MLSTTSTKDLPMGTTAQLTFCHCRLRRSGPGLDEFSSAKQGKKGQTVSGHEKRRPLKYF